MAIDLPGRDGDLARLLEAYRTVGRGDKGGQTVVVAGDEGSGRTALLRALAANVASVSPAPTVLGGGFRDGVFVAWGDEPVPPAEKVVAVVQNVVALADALTPYAALLGQLLKSEAALELVRSLFGQPERLSPVAFLPRLMRELCATGPVLCLVDDADHAPSGLWNDIVLELAGSVATQQPLMLVLAMQRPQQLARHEDEESDSLYAARRLVDHGAARWHPLARMTVDDLGRWTGAAEPDVLARLHDVTGGRAGWAAELWRHWRTSAVVSEGEDGTGWRFAPDGRQRASDPVGDVFGARLELATGAAAGAGAGAPTPAEVRELLACAVLEGRRFTAEAVAVALERDRDEVIDMLDDRLLLDEAHPDGLVLEAGSVSVEDASGTRHAWLYRFANELDWLTLVHHGLPDDERRELAALLATALGALYGGASHEAAGTLARLYELAGDTGAARRQRRISDAGGSPPVILWRAQQVFAADEPGERADRRRASQILLAAASELCRGGPYADGLECGFAAYRLAPLRRDRATALYLTGLHHFNLGALEQARTQLMLALDLQRELADRASEATTRHALAFVDSRRGDYEAARAGLTAALESYVELRDREGEIAGRRSLAGLELAQGEHGRARIELNAVLELLRERGDMRGVADTHHEIARLDLEQGALDAARRGLLGALELYRELGDRHGEADARHNLARLDIEEDKLDDAREEFTRVLDVYRGLGDRHGEAATRHSLASVDIEQGVWMRARRELKRVLDIGHELGDEEVIAVAEQGLAVLDEAEAAQGLDED